MSRDYIEVDSWLAAGDKYNVCVGGPDRLLTYMYSYNPVRPVLLPVWIVVVYIAKCVFKC